MINSLPPNPPSPSTMLDWCRKVAFAVNQLINRRQFPASAVAPDDPQTGDGWFDTAVSKAKIWDGTAWNALW